MFAENKLLTSLLLSAAILILGCRNSTIEQLRKENPFTHDRANQPREILYVTCRYTSIEYPGSYELITSSFWQTYELTQSNAIGHEGVVSGFEPDSIARLNRNGLKIAIAPLNQWEPLRQQLISIAAVEYPTRMAMVRNLSEAIESNGYWIDHEKSLFLRLDKTLRGYTLPPGQWQFRTSCNPANPDDHQTKAVNLRIIPTFLSVTSQPWKINPSLPRTGDFELTAFPDLALTGQLKNGYFLAATVDTTDLQIDNLGNLILKQPTPGSNRLLMAWAPIADTAVESHLQPNTP